MLVDDVEVVDSIPRAYFDAAHFSLTGKTSPVSPTCRRSVYNCKKADFFSSYSYYTIPIETIFIMKDINSKRK